MQKAAIYCRVSTGDQNCARQEQDLLAFAERAGYDVVAVFKETASGSKNDRIKRKQVMAMAQSRDIDAILVTEMTRWGRTTIDLLSTLSDLASFNVSLVAQTGMTYDMSTAQGKLIAGMMANLAEFEKDLLRERVKSGMKAAIARGVKVGRPEGNKTISKHEKAVIELLDLNFSYREIASKLKIGTETVMKISKARRAGSEVA